MDTLTPHVYVEPGYRGGTVGAITTPRGVICIDTPLLPSEARRWQAQIEAVVGAPVIYTIYTDGHRDRVLGTQWLGGQVVAHETTWEKLRSYGDAIRQQVIEYLAHHGEAAAAEELAHSLQLCLPELTLGANSTLTLCHAKPKVVVRAVGGATPGSLWVELPDQGVVFTGDLVTQNTHPFMAEAHTASWLARLEELRAPQYFASKIVPGRGNNYKRADVQKMQSYLQDMREQVQLAMRQRRGKFDAGELIAQFAGRFPVPDSEHERIYRRVRIGLEKVYEELKTEKRRKKKP